MVVFVVLAFVGWLLTGALCAEFLNPPNMGKNNDFSTNPTYISGEVLNVVWSESEEGQKCSLVLYQVNKTSGRDFGDWEFLTRDAVDVTSYKWLVGTEKDLDESDVFFLAYYQEGRTSPNIQSRFFNLKARDPGSRPQPSSQAPPENTPSSTPGPVSRPGAEITGRPKPTSTSTDSQLSISSPTNTPANPSPSLSQNPSNSTSTSDNQSSTSSSPTDPSSSPSNTPSLPDPPGIPITAVIGICVGILVVLLIIIIAVFLCLRRRKQHLATSASSRSSQSDLNKDDEYYRPNLPEAPERSPKEMGQLPGLWTTHPELPIRSPGELGTNGDLWTGRPELPDKPLVELGENRKLWTGRPELPDKHASVHTVRYELY